MKIVLVQMLLLVLGSLVAQPALSADEIRVETEYDARGQVLRRSLPHRSGETVRWTEFRHDNLDRQIRLTHPDGSSVTTSYLPGHQFGAVETVDESANKQASHFDAFGNEIYRDRYDQALRLRTSYQYDVLGRLIDIRDAKGSVYWYAYDGHGNRIFDADPDLGCREMAYDAGNRLKEQRSASGALVSYSYDALNRVTAKTADKDALQFSDCSFPIISGSRTETGGSGNDTLDAGDGRLSDVTLSGGSGDDIYIIRARSGHVVIPSSAEGANGGTDTIRFVDLVLADLTISEVADPQGGEFLQFSWDKYGVSGSLKVAQLGDHIERFEFADGSVVSRVAIEAAYGRSQLWGTAGDDLIVGTSDSTIIYAGDGDDTLDAGGYGGRWQHLRGQLGDDTYLIGLDDGIVWITQTGEWAASGTDTVRFKDLVLSDLEISTYSHVNYGEALRLSWDQDGQQGSLFLSDLGDHIERFEFADGSVVSRVAVEAAYGRSQLWGTAGDDLIVGTSDSTIIYAGDGDDTLDAGGYGGRWQHLRGQLGDDTYLIGLDDGIVWITQTGEWAASGTDTVRFKDLVLSDLEISTYSHVNYGEALRLSWDQDGQQGSLFLSDLGDHIERFEFADGSVRTAGELQP